jgi:hypothetical protein
MYPTFPWLIALCECEDSLLLLWEECIAAVAGVRCEWCDRERVRVRCALLLAAIVVCTHLLFSLLPHLVHFPVPHATSHHTQVSLRLRYQDSLNYSNCLLTIHKLQYHWADPRAKAGRRKSKRRRVCPGGEAGATLNHPSSSRSQLRHITPWLP